MGSITHINLLLTFLILFFPSANSSSDSGCIESERKALLEFKASLVSGSSSLSSWTGRDCCSWDGITCHNLTRHVQALNLGVQSSPSYPTLLGSENSFNSPLSPWLFNLTHLEVLTISSNLIGPIPNMFDKLTSLTFLDLSGNSFGYAFPDSLCRLTSVTQMYFSESRLQGSLPSCLGNMTSLTMLQLDGNELSGKIPDSLGFLTHLIYLDLSQNQFNSSIPYTFGNLRDLEGLFLQSNQLSGAFPSTLGKLTKLIRLDVSYNNLTGELSESVLEGLISLEHLDISRNQFLLFNVSPQWIPPIQLSSITMDSVFVGTKYPQWLRTQRNLEELVMINARIYGVIPDSAHPNLTHINLSDNFLSGHVPKFDSASLQTLRLSGNQLSGNIPQHLCNLTSLENLSLGNNQLTGRIPSCLGSLRSLHILDLANNNLFGHIPNELGSLIRLASLHLNGNKLSGKIPSALQNLNSLVTLDLGDTELHGSIPKWIGKEFWGLEFLRLESNNISGEIPVNLCQLPSLQILNLAHNGLVGTIPPCLGNLSKMFSNESGYAMYGNFSYDETLLNIIKGREMKYTSSLPYAKFITLSSNHLRGEIPVELMNLKGLQSLNLSNNDLTGMIPETINNLTHLESLDLSMNRLFGTIPQSLADIDALSSLNLSFNNLEGKIPSGNHFDTLNDPSIYEGNMRLCGKLLMNSCPGDDSTTFNQANGHGIADDEFDQTSWIGAGIGPGFAVGLLAVMCSLYFKDQWRIAYFGFADNVYNKVKVILTIKISQFRRKFN